MVNRAELLRRISTLDFMLMDLALYLNTHPTDKNAIKVHTKASKDASEMRKKYEDLFGPLTNRSENGCEQDWRWVKDPWPWDYDHNFDI